MHETALYQKVWICHRTCNHWPEALDGIAKQICIWPQNGATFVLVSEMNLGRGGPEGAGAIGVTFAFSHFLKSCRFARTSRPLLRTSIQQKLQAPKSNRSRRRNTRLWEPIQTNIQISHQSEAEACKSLAIAWQMPHQNVFSGFPRAPQSSPSSPEPARPR